MIINGKNGKVEINKPHIFVNPWSPLSNRDKFSLKNIREGREAGGYKWPGNSHWIYISSVALNLYTYSDHLCGNEHMNTTVMR